MTTPDTPATALLSQARELCEWIAEDEESDTGCVRITTAKAASALLAAIDSFTESPERYEGGDAKANVATPQVDAQTPAASDPVAHQSPTSPGSPAFSGLFWCRVCNDVVRGGIRPHHCNRPCARLYALEPVPPLDPSALRDGEVWSADDDVALHGAEVHLAGGDGTVLP